MSDFVVHSIPGSPFGRAVLMALAEKGVTARLAPVKPGMHRQPEHLARHPFGKVPVLDHGDFSLYETAAILRYVDRVLPEPRLIPAAARDAARMDQLLCINDCYLFQDVCNVIAFQRVVGPKIMGLTPDEAVIAAALPKARTVIDELSRLLGDKPFFTGTELSLADLMLAAQMDFMAMTPEWESLTADRPNIRAWLARMRARPSMMNTTWERVAAMAQAA